jgi:thiol-disulfide isomerase/thioredoxin
MVRELKTLEEFKTLIESDTFVVVDFTATWCGPVRFMFAPFYTRVLILHSLAASVSCSNLNNRLSCSLNVSSPCPLPSFYFGIRSAVSSEAQHFYCIYCRLYPQHIY